MQPDREPRKASELYIVLWALRLEVPSLGKQPSIIKQAINRREDKMAIGQSRYKAKRAAREQNPSDWTVSTEKIHSQGSRGVRRAVQDGPP